MRLLTSWLLITPLLIWSTGCDQPVTAPPDESAPAGLPGPNDPAGPPLDESGYPPASDDYAPPQGFQGIPESTGEPADPALNEPSMNVPSTGQ